MGDIRGAHGPLEVIASRLSGSSDGRRLALVLPGGGMVGSWQMGFLAALEAQAGRVLFDLVVGSSAGGINAMYAAAGQCSDAVTAYTDVLPASRFVNPPRIWKMMDIDFLVDVVVERLVPLDRTALLASPVEAYAIATELRTGAAHLFAKDHPELREVMRATAALPLVYGRAPVVGDLRFMDGGLSSPFPVEEAFGLGATDVLVVVPHAPGRRWVKQTGIIDASIAAWCRWRSPEAGVATYRRAPILFDVGISSCENPSRPDIACVFPSDSSKVPSRAAKDRAVLHAAAAQGAADLHNLLRRLPAV